ncbi:metallophosphoesterase [Candidatus Woesearchaeota archaeon]|nr:metallophosphoesterase [Candidatus Woesearchaeota archaeon]
MRFAHLADIHIGAWRDPAMKSLSLEAFKRAVAIIIEKRLDFAMISGDLFNTAVPAIDHLQETVIQLKKLKTNSTPVYVVPGSHDYSASGKTILDVLEEADLLINVMKGKVTDGKLRLVFTEDSKTKALLTGIGGRRGSLDQKEYEGLNLEELESKAGQKIFLFHTSIEELKPDSMYAMLSMSIDALPKGFDYYAGGHVHIVSKEDFPGRKNVIYPGPIFPANFSELWSLERGGFYMVEDGAPKFQPLNIKNVFKIDVSADKKTPEEVTHDLFSKVKLKEFNNTIVLVKVHGELSSGKPSDIDFKGFTSELYSKSAFFVMRNTTKLTSKEFTEIGQHSGTAEEIEDGMIQAHSEKKQSSANEAERIKALLHALSDEQKDGEKKYEYDARMKKDADNIMS